VGGAALLLLVAAAAILWRRKRSSRSRASVGQAKQPPPSPELERDQEAPDKASQPGDGQAALVPVVWQPRVPAQHDTTVDSSTATNANNPLFQPRTPHSSSDEQATQMDQRQPVSTAASSTPPAATSVTRATAAATIKGDTRSSSGMGTATGRDQALVMSPAASADVTALLDERSLNQLLIAWSDIKLADKPLGRGGFGAVYRGSWQGIKVAVKMLEGVSTSAAGDLRREALMMSRVRHPGIAAVYGLAISDSDQQATGDGRAAVALVMK
jgi:hypothetical protein